MSFSIFIASSTTTTSPFLTACPTEAFTPTILPGMGAVTVTEPAVPAGTGAGSGRRCRCRSRCGSRSGCRSHRRRCCHYRSHRSSRHNHRRCCCTLLNSYNVCSSVHSDCIGLHSNFLLKIFLVIFSADISPLLLFFLYTLPSSSAVCPADGANHQAIGGGSLVSSDGCCDYSHKILVLGSRDSRRHHSCQLLVLIACGSCRR